MSSGRPKGGTNKYGTAKEKEKILLECKEKGIEGLENQKKPDNPLCKYSNKKKLSEVQKLQYENMKLRIENER